VSDLEGIGVLSICKFVQNDVSFKFIRNDSSLVRMLSDLDLISEWRLV
jgi:hypothetical protein